MYQIGAARPAYARLGEALGELLSELLGEQVTYSDTALDARVHGELIDGESMDGERLILTQVCGFPFEHTLKDRWTLVGTPSFSCLPNDPPGHYHSVLIAPAQDHRSLMALCSDTVAVSEALSQSGHHGLLQHLVMAGASSPPLRVIQTGSHANSLRAVALAEASLASLDAISFHLLGLSNPALVKKVRIVAETQPVPGLPLVVRAPFAHVQPRLAEALQTWVDAGFTRDVGWSSFETGLDYSELRRRRRDALQAGWDSLL